MENLRVYSFDETAVNNNRDPIYSSHSLNISDNLAVSSKLSCH